MSARRVGMAITARRRSTSTSSSTSPTARRSRSSVRTAPARRRCCARSRVCVPIDDGSHRARRRACSTTGGAVRFVVARAAVRRCGVPGLPAVPAPQRARERRVRSARAAASRRARRARRGAGWLAASGSPTTRRAKPASSPAASRSGSRWRARWRPSRACSLLDEPLAALDVGTRTELRRELRAHLATFDGARVLVTHDPLDAVALADRLVVLEDGRVVQSGTCRGVGAAPLALRRRARGREPAAGGTGTENTVGSMVAPPWSPPSASTETCTSRSNRTR